MIFTRTFWLEALERSLKTVAQSLIIMFTAAEGFNLFSVDWPTAGGFALGGAVLSILTSIASAPFGANNSPSLVKGEPGLDVGQEPNPPAPIPAPRHLSEVPPEQL